MPIVDLQRRVMEVGRIRMGVTGTSSKGKPIPKRLDTWRLTSRDEARIRAAADAFGGTVGRWEEGDAWEVITTTDTLRVVLIPGQSFSQWWEQWGQQGGKGAHRCLRRCDGRWDHLNDKPCSCPPLDERKDVEGTCEPHTRLSVLLPDLPGVGTWRLETQSWYAAIELAGIAEFLEALSARGEMRPARLRIDKRKSVNADGQTTVFPVPTLDVEMAIDSHVLAAPMPSGEVEGRYAGALEAPPTLGPAAAVEELRRRELEPPSRQGRQTADIGPSGFVPDTTPLPEPEERETVVPPPPVAAEAQTIIDAAPLEEAAKEPPPKPEPQEAPAAEAPAPPQEPDPGIAGLISQAQRRKLFALARQVGLSEDQLRELVATVNDGDTSTGSLPVEKFDGLLQLVANAGEIVAAKA